jgi:hypothetical protein
MTQQKQSAGTRKRGEILDTIGESIEVNTLRNIPLDVSYYISNNRVFKKLRNGKFRALVKQETRPEYKHYFFRDKNKKKLTLNANKLNLLSLRMDQEEPAENFTSDEKDTNVDNDTEQLSTESGIEITEAQVCSPG